MEFRLITMRNNGDVITNFATIVQIVEQYVDADKPEIIDALLSERN